MNMATRSQTRLGTGVRLVDPVASGGGVRAVPASSSARNRGGASAEPDLVGSPRDGAIFGDRGRGGLTGRAHHDRGGLQAQTQPVRGRPDHPFFQQDHARSDDSGRDRGPGQNGVARTRVAGAELPAAGTFLRTVPVQGGRGSEAPLPYVGRLHDFDARSPRPRANMTNSAPSRPQGRGGVRGVLPSTASGHKDLPRSFEERLAEDMLDEGLSLKNPARGVRGVGSENEDSDAQLRDSVRRRAEGPHAKRAFERLPSSDAQGAPDFAELPGKPLQVLFQTRVGGVGLARESARATTACGLLAIRHE